MADATSLMPPGPGLSATLFSNIVVEPYSLKGPENVPNIIVVGIILVLLI